MRATLFGLLLVICAGILFWTQMEDEAVAPDALIDRARYTPDFSASVLHSIQYNQAGTPKSKVWAEDMKHYEQLGLTEFSNPILLIYPEDGETTWQITAKQGMLQGKETATLQQNVVISSKNDEDQLNTVHTSYLEIDLVNQTLRSDRPVRLVGPRFILNGVGLEADAHSEQIKILDQIQAVYEPY